MSDSVELIPASEQEEAVFRAWESGKSLRVVAREFALSVPQVEQVLERMLPAFDAKNNLAAFKREIDRLESLSCEFYTIAKRDRCRDSAHLVARLNERICAMRGWTAINIRVDPMATQLAEQPQGFAKIRETLFRLKYGDDWRAHCGDGDGAVLPSDDAPSR